MIWIAISQTSPWGIKSILKIHGVSYLSRMVLVVSHLMENVDVQMDPFHSQSLIDTGHKVLIRNF